MIEIYSLTIFLFGLGSQTGFFGIVLCPKVKHNLLSHQLFYMLFEYLCDSNINQRTNGPVKAHLINSIIQSIKAFTASFIPIK